MNKKISISIDSLISEVDSKFQASPLLLRPNIIIGNNIIFKDATLDDADFILKLRLSSRNSNFISTTSNDLELQKEWLKKYSNDFSQIYFVIYDRENEKVGTVRLYDKQNDSFCWGSWILMEGCKSIFAIESALLVYSFGLFLGFKRSHFEVSKGNISVWKFHEKFGASRVAEKQDSFLYSISNEEIKKSLMKYKKYLPNGFFVETNCSN